MADDTVEPQATNAPAADNTAGATTTSEPPKKFPKGVVLGKDGKPCRSCTSFAAWASQTKSSLKASSQAPSTTPKDCPPDVEQLGRSTWTLLHSIAATYPPAPTPREQSDLKSFMRLFSKLYPCWVCAEDFQRYMDKQEIKAGSRDELGNWLCEAHNEVNRKLGKPVFDCRLWQERWRTGWKDGSCD
ncbi:Flavin-linked sulfhydryl oxidase of the mitochondrial IMS [Madurella fahalii]|uniref:Sulfhydryl oxidase n=1 Tax=Madurella fahalii TaxID=1157608 RepID=A0ABQ0GHM6_9PEZI